MSKVFTTSLFGNNPRYLVPLLENLSFVQEHLPDWRVRVYRNASVPHGYVNQISQSPVCEISYVDIPNYGLSGTYWRFNAFFDKALTHVICLDADLHLRQIYVDLISDWLQRPERLMSRRRVVHSKDAPLICEWVGLKLPIKRCNVTRPLYELEREHSVYGDDERWLNKLLLPLYAGDHIEYQQQGCESSPHSMTVKIVPELVW